MIVLWLIGGNTNEKHFIYSYLVEMLLEHTTRNS
ncbi:MAG: hypothetical protein ACJAS1_006910, partial [Oleiphilaceae bacterium]